MLSVRFKFRVLRLMVGLSKLEREDTKISLSFAMSVPPEVVPIERRYDFRPEVTSVDLVNERIASFVLMYSVVRFKVVFVSVLVLFSMVRFSMVVGARLSGVAKTSVEATDSLLMSSTAFVL